MMNIICKSTVNYYINKYPKAKIPLITWFKEFSKQEFKNFNELKNKYGNASLIGKNRVVFNIKANDFRLLVSINFRKKAAYIIWFGSHEEYDNINVETIKFDFKTMNTSKK